MKKENNMPTDPEDFDGDEGGEEAPQEPPKYLITDEELHSLSEGVEVPGLDADSVLADAQAILLRLDPCRMISPATGEPHERPSVNVDWSVTDQVVIGKALLIVENLRKFNQGGYVPGVVYRGLTKKGELRTVVREGSAFTIDDLTHTDIVSALEMAACWIKITKTEIKHAEPRGSVKAQVSARHIPYPPLKAVVQAPRWSFDGTTYNVAHTIGYDPATATFIGRDFKITRKAKPTDKDVAAALGVFEDLIGEFPYADEASRRNAYALALTMPLRPLTTTAPLFPVDAHDPGSGKTLLAETITAATFGVIPTPKKLAYNEGDQERRNITAMLRDTTTDIDVVWFDEPRKSSQTTEIVSDTLNVIATAAAGQYEDRPVMQKLSISLNTVLTFILTGNNLALNSELQRRTVRIELTRSNGKSFSRTEDELREHAIASQGAFHQAVATLIDNWVAKGCPQPVHTPQFPSFNAWLTLVGGILEAAGIEGLRQNPDTAGPYTAARAEWLEWIKTNVDGVTEDGAKTIEQQAIVKTLNSGTQAKRKKALARLEKLVHFGTPKDSTEWDKLVERVRTGTVKSNGFTRQMKLCLVQQTWDFGDGRSIFVKRLEDNGTDPVRYRLSTVKKNLDRRAGQNLPKRRASRS